MADGKITIDIDLNEKDSIGTIKELQSTLKDLSSLGNSFKSFNNITSTFSKSFGALSTIIGSTAAKVTAGIGTMVIAFNQLYETSKKNFLQNIEKMGNTLQPAVTLVQNFASEVIQAFSQITGFEFSFSSMTKEAIEFESTMASVAAVMGATGDGINQITQTARQFGAQTRYSATQVAEAFTYMGMAQDIGPAIK
ncbi:MAG: phage tail tape measure protein [Sarcina sp.]